MDFALSTALLVGVLVAIATIGAAVWCYNRLLAPFVELPIKKPAALLALPSGIPIGLLAAWRMSEDSIGLAESALWLLVAVIGALVLLRLIIARINSSLLQRTSRYRRVEGMPPALDWWQFPFWQRIALFFLLPVNQVGSLRIHEREVLLPGLSSDFDGFRMVHVTDPHIHPTLRPEWYSACIDAAMELQPDIVLHGGDFITQPPYLAEAAQVLRPLSNAPDGAFTVRGNHDLWKAPQRSRRAAKTAGMRLLSNEGVVIRRGESAISLIGLEEPYLAIGPESESHLRRLPLPRIALVHTPDAFPLANQLRCALALGGHTHGGQVRLPLIGATVTSSAAGPRHATGISRMGNMLCMVSNGMGAFFPLRFLCPPEITLIVLRSPDSA